MFNHKIFKNRKIFLSGASLQDKSLTGFTLIEIIIALTILAIGLVSLAAYLPVALEAARKGSDLTKAAIIAQNLLEEVKNSSYTDITGADVWHTAASFNNYSDFAGFEYQINVNPLGVAEIKDITITVRWQFKGKNNMQTFETKIVKYNPT